MSASFKIAFCGDTSLGYYYLEKGKNNFQEAYSRLKKEPMSFFSGVKHFLDECDEVVVNFEAVLSKRPGSPLAGKDFTGYDDPLVTIGVLNSLGVTSASLANNHTYDYGKEGLYDTARYLNEGGISTFGVGDNVEEAVKPYHIPIVVDGEYKDIYIFSAMRAAKIYHEEYQCFAGENKPGIADALSEKFCDEIAKIKNINPKSYVVVFWHRQGADYSLASERIKKINENFVNSGADMVVGHGTHTIGQCGWVNGVPIIYSLGNFIFNSPGGYVRKEALPFGGVLCVEFYVKENKLRVCPKLYPIFSDNRETGYNSRPANRKEMDKIKSVLVNNSLDEEGKSLEVRKDSKGFYFGMGEQVISRGKKMNKLSELPKGEKNTYVKTGRFSTKAYIEKEMKRLGCRTESNGKLLIAYKGKSSCAFYETETTFTSLLGARIAKDKERAKFYLAKFNVNVAHGKAFSVDEKEKAKSWGLARNNTLVIKPSHGNKGKGVTVGVDDSNFDIAWASAKKIAKKQIIVEEAFLDGEEARYLVVDGKCVAVSFRIPPFVLGDGEKNIRELIERENEIRKGNPNTAHRPIKMDDSRLKYINSLGYTLESVLDVGQELYIDKKANISTGASAMDITNLVHPEMKKVAENAALCFPGLDVIGVDILAKNHMDAPSEKSYIVVEINTRPGIGGHHFPAYGSAVNVARHIAESCVSKMRDLE